MAVRHLVRWEARTAADEKETSVKSVMENQQGTLPDRFDDSKSAGMKTNMCKSLCCLPDFGQSGYSQSASLLG